MNVETPIAAQRTFRSIGTRPVRPDGVDKVTGRARFGADAALPGMLVGKVLRSPHAHARIVSIDTSAAESASRRQGGGHPGRISTAQTCRETCPPCWRT